MFCAKCGQETKDGEKFCAHCGNPLGGNAGTPQAATRVGGAVGVTPRAGVPGVTPGQVPPAAGVGIPGVGAQTSPFAGATGIGARAKTGPAFPYSKVLADFAPVMLQYTVIFLVLAFLLTFILVALIGTNIVSIVNSSIGSYSSMRFSFPIDPRYGIAALPLIFGGTLSADFSAAASTSSYLEASASGSMFGEAVLPVLTLGAIVMVAVWFFGRKICKANTPLTFGSGPLITVINSAVTGIVIAAIYAILAMILPYNLNFSNDMGIVGVEVVGKFSGLSFRSFIVLALWGFLSVLVAEWLRKAAAEGKTVRTCIREVTAKLPFVSDVWSVLSNQLLVGLVALVATIIIMIAQGVTSQQYGTEALLGTIVGYLLLPMWAFVSTILDAASVSWNYFGNFSQAVSGSGFQAGDYSIFDLADQYARTLPDVPVLFIWFVCYVVFAIVFAFVRARHASVHNPVVPGRPFDGKRFGLFLVADVVLWIVLVFLVQISVDMSAVGSTSYSSSSSSGAGAVTISISFLAVFFGALFAAIAELLAVFVLPSLVMKMPALLAFQNSAFINFLAGCPKGGVSPGESMPNQGYPGYPVSPVGQVGQGAQTAQSYQTVPGTQIGQNPHVNQPYQNNQNPPMR